jgi:hypothetical protein
MASSTIPSGNQLFANQHTNRDYITRTAFVTFNVPTMAAARTCQAVINRVGNNVTMTLNNFPNTAKNGTAQVLDIPGVIPPEFRPARDLTVFTVIRYAGPYTPVIVYIHDDGAVSITRDYAGRDIEAGVNVGWDRMVMTWSTNTGDFA